MPPEGVWETEGSGRLWMWARTREAKTFPQLPEFPTMPQISVQLFPEALLAFQSPITQIQKWSFHPLREGSVPMCQASVSASCACGHHLTEFISALNPSSPDQYRRLK